VTKPESKVKREWTAFLLATLAAGAASASGFGFLAETPMSRFNGDDMKMMNAAIERALESSDFGTQVAWANDGTRSSGEVTPLRAFDRQGRPCRELRVVNRNRALENSGVYTMCRENGRWTLVK
jgi:surface antigen